MDTGSALASSPALPPLDPAWVGLSAANVYDASGRRGDMAPTIRQMVPGTRCVGRALTVRCPIGDWSAGARAVDLARPGDVIVIDVGGSERSIGWGGTASAFCQQRGIAGAVTNGSVRDLDEIRELGFPVFAAGACVRGALRAHDGWIGIPVSVGDVVVFPGDVVVADADGVVVVAHALEDVVLDNIGPMLERAERMARHLSTASSYAELTAKSSPPQPPGQAGS